MSESVRSPLGGVHGGAGPVELIPHPLKCGDRALPRNSLDPTPALSRQCGDGNLPSVCGMQEGQMLADRNGAPTGIHNSPASTVARYEALIRVSEALRAYHDRDTLFRSLARELRPVVRFSFLGLGLYDEHTDGLDLRVLEATGKPLPPPQLAAEESLTYWTVQHQAPLVIPDVEGENRFPKAMAYLRGQDVRSTCSLPLTTPRRRIGMMVAGDSELHVYDTKDVTFLSLVANQVALAIDDALNYTALQQSLLVERERQRSLDASDDLLRAMQPCSTSGRCFRESRRSRRRCCPTTC